ncbi:MAG: HAMP domain-containing histidine kinase [Deltaproteobacteria bacterium]|nr:HAMP domain-containing histidine kinase [Deltaproteobacteria bacterium]
MRVPGAHLSLPGKLSLLAGFVLTLTACLQLWLVQVTAGSSDLVKALAMVLPMGPPTLFVLLLGRYVVGRLTIPVIAAYRRVAAGDLHAELPPMTAGSDFVALREAFASMGHALDRSIKKVQAADAERRKLFADLAHELATPTSTLMGIAAALRQGSGDRERLLGHLEHESARLERLIADIREVAHLEDPTLPMLREPCDVAALAAAAAERARLAPGASCEVRCDIAPASAEVDPLRIDQVLVNLLSNAARHAPGGVVALAVGTQAADVIIRVEDSGPGVPDALLPELGRRLLRVDASRSRDTGGHGLGLSIVRAIVARHDGQVTFTRAALGGLGVEVRLPREARPAAGGGAGGGAHAGAAATAA